jgi:indole-3-glycerol phosphate synthase
LFQVTSDLLSAIAECARTSAEYWSRSANRAAVEREAASRTPRGDTFRHALWAPGVRVIAECKRRSPSRGILRAGYDPAAIAMGYDAAGAAAISVLTEPAFFDGSLEHLRAVRRVTSLPILRKDFVVTEFQMIEARAAGADAVLLIVGALHDPGLRRLIELADTHQLAALVEVHDRVELTRALDAGARTIGVNSRNLRTLDVHPEVFDELILAIPDDAVAVAESGLKSGDDVRRLRGAGYDAFLVGERLMLEADPGRALAALRASADVAVGERR